MTIVIGTFLKYVSYTSNILEEDNEEVYTLKLFDKELLRLVMKRDVLEGVNVRILKVNQGMKKYLPPDLELKNEGVREWLKRRIIPKNRAFVKEILRTLGLKSGDTKGIIDVCKGLSLNDSYWVVPLGFEGRFDIIFTRIDFPRYYR